MKFIRALKTVIIISTLFFTNQLLAKDEEGLIIFDTKDNPEWYSLINEKNTFGYDISIDKDYVPAETKEFVVHIKQNRDPSIVPLFGTINFTDDKHFWGSLCRIVVTRRANEPFIVRGKCESQLPDPRYAVKQLTPSSILITTNFSGK